MSNYGWLDLPPELSDRNIRVGGDVISGSGTVHVDFCDDPEYSASLLLTVAEARALAQMFLTAADEAEKRWQERESTGA